MAETKTLIKQEFKEKAKDLASFINKSKFKTEAKQLAIFLGLFSLAVSGRVALQGIPSIEPIIPLAILAGMMYGMKEGFVLGGSAYIVSNFFIWGLQGPWTIFQAIGGAFAGLLGGVAGNFNKIKSNDFITLSIYATLLYEVIVNIGGSLFWIGLAGGLLTLPMYFLTSAPFSALHLAGNIFFAKFLTPLLKYRRKKDEVKIISFSRIIDGNRTDVRLYNSTD